MMAKFEVQNSRCRAHLVLTAIFLQTISTMSVAYGSSSYYVIAFERRGVPGYLVGLFSFGPGLGVLIGFFFDTTHYMIYRHNISMYLVVCGALISTILICAGTGLAALFSSNLLALILMILLRVLFGFLELRLCEIAVECCKFWFPRHFRVVQGVTNGGYYLGAAIFNQLSGVMFDFWDNFTTPYVVFAVIVSFCLIFNAVVLPNTSSTDLPGERKCNYKRLESGESIQSPHPQGYVYGWVSGVSTQNEDPLVATEHQMERQDSDLITLSVTESRQSSDLISLPPGETRSDSTSSEKRKMEDCGLSPVILIPMAGDICFNMMYGYAAALVVPYLNEVFGVSISQASVFLVLLNLAMMAGSSVAGALLQANLLSSAKLSALAAMLGFVGSWFLFPPVRIAGLFEQVPNVGYMFVCFVGFATMMGSVTSYKTMEAVQVRAVKHELSVDVKSRITTVWYTGVATAMYAGSTVAVLASRYLTPDHGNWFLISWMVVALSLNLIVITFIGDTDKGIKITEGDR